MNERTKVLIAGAVTVYIAVMLISSSIVLSNTEFVIANPGRIALITCNDETQWTRVVPSKIFCKIK